VERSPFERSIDEDGRTRVRDRYVVAAPLTGRLARIGLREGDTVQAGSVLANLTPVLPPLLDERTLREQQARVEAARAQLARAGARAARARVAQSQAAADFKRSEQLASTGFVALTKLDSDRLAVDAAARELETAIHEERVAGYDLQQAIAAAAAMTPGPAREPFAVRAPVSGQVLRVLAGSETSVTLGTPLLELGDLSRLEIVVEMLTSDALQAPPGTVVRVERWGGSVELAGRVRRVEPAAFTKVSALGVEEQRVNVLVDLVDPRERWQALGDGYRVEVRVITLALGNALQVPVSAVFPLPDSSGMAVYVVEGGRARHVPVEVGARNGRRAWIRKGLDEGMTVIDFPPSGVRDGARVRPRPKRRRRRQAERWTD
jgi:HlyD family secretion protein